MDPLELRTAAARHPAAGARRGRRADRRPAFSTTPRGAKPRAFTCATATASSRLMAAGVTVAVISGRRSPAAAGPPGRTAGAPRLPRPERQAPGARPAAGGTRRTAPATWPASATTSPISRSWRLAGLGITVADAHPDVLRAADWVTAAAGGRGAVREVCDLLLASRQPRLTSARMELQHPVRLAAAGRRGAGHHLARVPHPSTEDEAPRAPALGLGLLRAGRPADRHGPRWPDPLPGVHGDRGAVAGGRHHHHAGRGGGLRAGRPGALETAGRPRTDTTGS